MKLKAKFDLLGITANKIYFGNIVSVDLTESQKFSGKKYSFMIVVCNDQGNWVAYVPEMFVAIE